jgi:hypothetical protein
MIRTTEGLNHSVENVNLRGALPSPGGAEANAVISMASVHGSADEGGGRVKKGTRRGSCFGQPYDVPGGWELNLT